MYKLDAKDKKILFNLDKNARQSLSSIAKATNLSKEVVNYRIKNLMKNDIIRGFNTVVDISKLGYNVFRIFIKYRCVNTEKENEILEYFRSHKNVGWYACYEGVYDIAVLIWAKDAFHFRDIYDDILNRYSDSFTRVYFTLVLRIYYFVNNFLYHSNDLTDVSIGMDVKNIPVDEKDVKILQLISRNARISCLDLSKEVDLTPNAVKYRIKNLIKSKVILGFKPLINIKKLGYNHYKVFMNLFDLTKKRKNELIEFLRLNKNISYITEAIGRADFEFEAMYKTSGEVHKLMQEIRTNFSDLIRDYETTNVSDEYRKSYFP